MSINMADVKQIMYGNKEVTKIEDGLGNVLWQKEVAVDPYIYQIQSDDRLYKLDMVNKVATKMNITGRFNTYGNKIFGYGNRWYLWNGDESQKIILDPDNNIIKFYGIYPYWPTDWHYNSNLIANLGPSRTQHLLSNYFYEITGQGTGTPLTGEPWARGNCVMKCDIVDGNNTYKYLGTPLEESKSSGTYLRAYDPDTDTYTTTDIPTYTGVRTNCWAFWHIGNRLLYDYWNDSKEFNFTTRQWQNHTWKNSPGAFNSTKTFVWNNRIFMVGGRTTDTTIYELDPSTDTWSVYWSGLPVGMSGDDMFDKKGSIALLSCGNRRFDRTL